MKNNELIELIENPDFIDYYSYKEDKWLQDANWEEKLIAVFGSIENAVNEFKKDDVFDYSPLSTKVQVIQNLISPSTIEELKKSVKSDLDNTNIIDVTIAGNPGISYIIGGICHGKATKFVKDKYEVTVSEYCTTRTSDYDQILSTFKFNE